MFDSIAPKKEPEDMFANLPEPSLSSSVKKEQPPSVAPAPPAPAPVPVPVPTVPSEPVFPQTPSRAATFAPPKYGGVWKMILLILVGLLVVVFAVAIAYKILTRTPLKTIDLPVQTKEEMFPQEPTVEQQTEQEPTILEPEVKQEVQIDTDQDGLTDEREQALGTDPKRVDTDDDGLFDKEEIETYKTDPLHPDTDADGYRDGEEVSNGYNPNGTGKLFEIPVVK